MRRADQIGGILLLVSSLAFTAVALQFTYWGPNGPGSGFLPFWLGVAMAVLATLLVISASRPGATDGTWLPAGSGLRRLVMVIVATIAFIALLPVVGMIPGLALFLIVLLRFLEGYSWRTSLTIAAGVAIGNYAVFVRWLGVPFPAGVLGF